MNITYTINIRYTTLDKLTNLIANGDDVNAVQDSYGNSLLHMACHQNLIDSVNALIVAGADMNAQNENGFTPLHIACCNTSNNIVEALIAAGANVNAQTIRGDTPLHVACMTCDVRIVQTLLEAGADPSIANYKGHLPQDVTKDKEIKGLIENFGLGGGCSTKAAQ